MESEADQHRLRGNALFQKGNYEDAIQQYTMAITKFPKAVYFMNRSVAHSKLFDWARCLQDAERSLEFEITPKAHYYVGLSILSLLIESEGGIEDEVGKRDLIIPGLSTYTEEHDLTKRLPPSERKLKTAIAHFRTAHHLAIQQKTWPFCAEIVKQLNRALKILYNVQKANEVRKLSEVEKWIFDKVNLQRVHEMDLVTREIDLERQRRKIVDLQQDLKESQLNVEPILQLDVATVEQVEKELPLPPDPEVILESNGDDLDLQLSEKLSHIQEEYDSNLAKLYQMLTSHPSISEIKDPNPKRPPIPDYLLGKITFTIMSDPVVSTKSGITYDRDEIMEHLRVNGRFDPLSRQDMGPNDLVPNLALKEVIEEYLDKNGWAAGE